MAGNKKYIDNIGLAHFWASVKAWAISQLNLKANNTDLSLKADKESPSFTGAPISTTPALTDNTTKIATTAFVKGQNYVTQAQYALKADLISPALTGTPTAPTAATATNTTQIATTAFVKGQNYATIASVSLKADKESPSFTGAPISTTPALTDNTTKIATTAFVKGQNYAVKTTTLAGYGIADVTIASGIIKIGGVSITPLTADSTLDATKLIGNGPINISGNAATATKATQDANGKVISSTYAPLASPALTGTPTTPTPTVGNNTTQIATTAFVKTAITTASSDNMLKTIYDTDGDGVVDKAEILNTARTISLSNGVVSTPTSFNGSANISIPITAFYESYAKWGGKNWSGTFGPFDASLNNNLGPNRLAGFHLGGVTIEYSTDSGSTWLNYGASDAQKKSLFTTSASIFLGGPSATKGNITAANQLRITIDGVNGGVYTELHKFHMLISSNGSSGQTVTLERALYGSDTTFSTILSNQPISGWSGWNVLNFNTLGGSGAFGGTNNTSHIRKLRFTFTNTSCSSSYNGLIISSIYAYGGVGWTTPSIMAATGYPFSYDYLMNTTFPANVTAQQFNGPLSGNAATATKATQDANGKVISSTYAPLDSPALTGTPIAPTPTVGTNSTQIATTAFVKGQFSAIAFTLIAASWTGTSAPYTLTVTIAGISATTHGTVGISDNATDAQYAACVAAQLRKVAQSTNSITIKAYGDKPAVDIPCTLLILGG